MLGKENDDNNDGGATDERVETADYKGFPALLLDSCRSETGRDHFRGFFTFQFSIF